MTVLVLEARDERGVVTLTLNRPELHNAFDERLIAELTARLDAVQGDESARVLVLASTGASFSAGADLNWMKRMAAYAPEDNRRDADALARLMQTLNFLPLPTIAAVQGPAFGGGVGLVAACDVAVAKPAVVFALTEVRLGLIPAVISPYVAPAIGERAARRYFLTGERFDAEEARRLGLVTEVADDLEGAVGRYVDHFLAGGPQAIAAAKKLIRRVARTPTNTAVIDDTAARIAAIRAGDEAKEGIAAFLEKRKPSWRR